MKVLREIQKSLFRKVLSVAGRGGGAIHKCVLSSCNNFIDGGNFKEQLEKDIAYAQTNRLRQRELKALH